MTFQISQRGKEYLETARTLLRPNHDRPCDCGSAQGSCRRLRAAGREGPAGSCGQGIGSLGCQRAKRAVGISRGTATSCTRQSGPRRIAGLERIWARSFDLSQNLNASEPASFVRRAQHMTASFLPLIRSASSWTRHLAAPMPIATGGSCRDRDHRRALQSLVSGKLLRADRHHLGLRRRLDAVLPDGRAAARRMDEAASGRAPGGVALRNRQMGWWPSDRARFVSNFRLRHAQISVWQSRPM